MTFIIEGPDHVGKTTVAREILNLMVKDFPIADLHHTSKPGTDQITLWWREQLPSPPRPCVFDRLHLGALVYGKWLGLHDAPNVNAKTVERFQAWMQDEGHRPFVLLMTADERWLSQKLSSSPKDEMFDNASILAANRHFKKCRSFADASFVCGNAGNALYHYPHVRKIEAWYAKWKEGWLT